MEGISGRMDGLDDRLGGLHKRLDDLDNRLDRHEMRLDAMPSSVGTPIKERIDGVERQVREQLTAALRGFDETGEGLRNLLGDTSVGLHRRLEDLAGRPAVGPRRASRSGSRRWLTRLDTVTARLDTLEDGRRRAAGRQVRQARRGAGASGPTRRPSASSWRGPTRSRSGATPGSSTRPWRRSPS